MRKNNYGEGTRKGRNYFFSSPLRSERTPSFAVNTAKNLWCDFGSANRNRGNIINLVEQLNPSWSEHQVLLYLEQQIRDLHLDFSEDYNARLEEEEEKRRWIEGNNELYNRLTHIGYHPRQRHFTARQTALIFEYLGEP